MAVSVAELAEALSKETILADMRQQWDRGKLAWTAGIPLADSATANSETKLTETGRWLLKALETMTGNAYWELSAEQYENRITVYNPASKLRFSIGRQELDERDPVTLLDCFTCAACGGDTSWIARHARWRVQDSKRNLGRPTRALCDSCGPISPERTTLQVEARNQRLGIHPQAILWQRGSYGVRLEKQMAIKYEQTEALTIPPPTEEEQADLRHWKQLGAQMGAAASLALDRHVAQVLYGQPAHEFRVGDRVRLKHGGAMVKIELLCGESIKVKGDGPMLTVGADEVEPLFKVGSRVQYGSDVGTIRSPSTEKQGQRWAVHIDGKSDDELWHRVDSDLELVSQVNGHDQYAWMPNTQPKPEQPVKPCDWCGDAYATSAKETDAHVRECVPLERLYRERLVAGGADCPEAREEVRRFVKRQRGNLIPRVETAWDDHRQSTRWGGKQVATLDQRIAAAQVEETPRHASDWEVFSGASWES